VFKVTDNPEIITKSLLLEKKKEGNGEWKKCCLNYKLLVAVP
jgi:hypothetical protein